jgi:hypothetical protein
MVFCQSHAVKLQLIGEDGKATVLYYATRKERDADKAFYQAHGFKCK